MTATEELRALLDELGVEWEDASPVPSTRQFKTSYATFTGESVTIADYDEPKWLMGTMVFLTPQQAVEATLGRGTCRMVLTELRDGAYHDVYECSECGEQTTVGTVMGESEPPRFCKGCGREVVG